MYHIKQTHNLEVPGSSPGWSTKERLISNGIEPFLFALPSAMPLLLPFMPVSIYVFQDDFTR